MKKGFTLIELLVVVSIIGILATLVTANLNSARSRARDAQRKSDARNIQTALRLYYNDNGRYPDAGDLPWGSGWNGAGSTVYMNLLPIDPLPSQSYLYELGSDADPADADTFRLSVCLENKSDDRGVDVASDGDPDTNANWCTTEWMFQVQP